MEFIDISNGCPYETNTQKAIQEQIEIRKMHIVQKIVNSLKKYGATLDGSQNIDNVISETDNFYIRCAYNHQIITNLIALSQAFIICNKCEFEKQQHIDSINCLISHYSSLVVTDINQYQIVTLKCPFGHILKREKHEIPDVCEICDYNKDSSIITNNTNNTNIPKKSWFHDQEEESNNDVPDDDKDDILADFQRPAYSDNEEDIDFSMESIDMGGQIDEDPAFDTHDEAVYFAAIQPGRRRRNTHMRHVLNPDEITDLFEKTELEETKDLSKQMDDYFKKLNECSIVEIKDDDICKKMSQDRDLEIQRIIEKRRSITQIEYKPNPAKPKIQRESNVPPINIENIPVNKIQFPLPVSFEISSRPPEKLDFEDKLFDIISKEA